MYFLHIYFENSRWNGAGEVCFSKNPHEIAKWTLISSGPSGQELLRLIATACAGTRLSARLPFAWQRLSRKTDRPLQVEFVLALHSADEGLPREATVWGSGIRVDGKGAPNILKKEQYRFLPPSIPARRAKTGLGHSNLFFLGYGSKLKHHDGTDDFDFSDPFGGAESRRRNSNRNESYGKARSEEGRPHRRSIRRFDQKTLITETTKERGGGNSGCDFLC